MDRGDTLFAVGRDIEAASDFQKVVEFSDDLGMRRDASLKLQSLRENKQQ
jgi:hypothetical protein